MLDETKRAVSDLLSFPGPLLVVAAHPDDEVIGLGGQLHRFDETWIAHTTDGAPEGRDDRVGYALRRRRELERAVAVAGIPPARLRALGATDQASIHVLNDLIERLTLLISEIRPSTIVTHPYEGGHPDHDTTALAVAVGVERVAALSLRVPRIVEFTSYHNGNPGGDAVMKVGEFLNGPFTEVETVVLDDEGRARKKEMLECFESQLEVLARFPIAVERFRWAPAYDFSRPPHEGRLFYEEQNWGVSGRQWRELAMQVLDARNGS